MTNTEVNGLSHRIAFFSKAGQRQIKLNTDIQPWREEKDSGVRNQKVNLWKLRRQGKITVLLCSTKVIVLLMTVVLLGKGQWRNTPRWRWTAKGSWHKVLHLKNCVSLTSFTRDATSPKHLPKHWRFVAWQFGHLGRGLFICNLKLSDLLLRLYSLVTCAV